MMLPSTGKFKEINCPFFNSTLCERPYCHFRHVKKDSSDSGSAPGSTALSLPEDGVTLQQLVSEAVRKVLQRTEILPGALTSTSPTHQVERVSDSLVNKVVEELTPPLAVSGSSQSCDDNSANAFSSQPKIPSYKPTPIAVLKRRHIPIPYSPSLTKNSCVLRKRTNSNEAVPVFKKFRIEPLDHNGFVTDKTPASSLPYSSESPSNSRKELPSDVHACEVGQYSPAPVNSWKRSGLSYTPSSIESLSSKHNAYVPSSRTSSQPSGVSYEPSDKSVSAVEPSYEPVTTNGLKVKGASYEPSTVSKSEPEYQPAYSDVNAKEYVPTDISKLGSIIDSGLSSDVLLHDILQKDLPGSDSDGHENSETVLDTQVNVIDSKVKLNSEKGKSDCSAQEIDDKRPRELEKKKTDSASSSSRKKADDKKREDSKRRDETEKRADECRKKKEQEKSKSNSEKKESSEGKKKESEKKKSNHEKKKSCELKRSDPEKKKGSDDRKRSNPEKKKRHSESKIEDGKKLTQNEKKSDGSKKRSDSEKKISDSEKRGVCDKKRDSDRKSDSGSDSHHKSSKKRDDKKHGVNKSSESRCKHSRESAVSLKTVARHKLSDAADQRKNSKMKIESKQRTDDHEKRTEWSDATWLEIVHAGAVSDSEISEAMEALADVTIPDDSWASSSDEETITKQCFKIFQEYEPSVKKKAPSYKPPLPVEECDPQVSKRKRVAHDNAQSSKMLRLSPIKRHTPANPSQILTERILKLKEVARSANTSISNALSLTSAVGAASLASNKQVPAIETKGVSTQTQVTPFPAGGKVRIAHVPNVNVLLNAKFKMQQQLKERQLSLNRQIPSTSTIAQSVPKGLQRVAHMPSDLTLSRPVICDMGGKIPANVRQKYLNMLVDEYLKISPAEQEAYDKAQEEEQSIHSRSTTRNLYVSFITNTISRLRKSAAAAGGSSKASEFRPVANRIVSHTSVLAGKGGAKGSWSIEKPRKPPSNVTGKSLYEQFAHFILTEQQLKDNGFPTLHPEEKGVAEIHAFFKQPFKPKSPNQRMCARCSRIYYVNNQGFAVKEEQCVYHWGRLFQSKTRGGWEARYNCCQSHGEGVGCSVGPCHVSDNFDPNNLRGFVKTLPKETPPADGNYGIYALDCEMCYTTVGLELTRVTVVRSDLNIVYETLVKPENPILDYNTRFSGIKEEDLEDVTTNIFEVQSVLLSFINDKSILVGHSLESDFKALKLVHDCVVDTSVVYPHKMGPPKKRALKSLCRELLHKIIQESEGGHDSAEDARAAMEVMLYKVKEEAKNW